MIGLKETSFNLYYRDGHEIAVTYYRAGYAPEDYPSEKASEEIYLYGCYNVLMDIQ